MYKISVDKDGDTAIAFLDALTFIPATYEDCGPTVEAQQETFVIRFNKHYAPVAEKSTLVQHLVVSKDRSARLVGEYWELFIRVDKLTKFVHNVKMGKIKQSSVVGPLYAHIRQLKDMKKYLGSLLIRGSIEQIDFNDPKWKTFEESAEQINLFEEVQENGSK